MDKFKRFRFFFYLPIIIIGLLCTIVFDWALYVQEEKTLQNWMQQIADAEILHLNRAMDRYINISAAIEDHLMENRGLPPGDYMRNLYFYSMSQSLREIEIQTAPDGQVRPIYPQSGSVLSGFNLFGENQFAKRAAYGRAQDVVVIESGVPMADGTTGMAVVRPVFMDRTADKSFWGYIVVAVDQDKLVHEANIDRLDQMGIVYTLMRKGYGESEYTLIDTNQNSTHRAIDAWSTIQSSGTVDGDEWRLIMHPTGGWVNFWLLFISTWAGLITTFIIAWLWQRNKRLRFIGETDALTGVFNRKGGDIAVDKYLRTNPRKSAMVIAVDVDNFKIINDVYGHAAGDLALKTFVRDMKRIFGANAIITRNGGDEFVIFCPYNNKEGVFNDMRRFTEEPHIFGFNDKEIHFTSSLGCAAYPEQGSNYGNLCIKADFALYGAKIDGKSGWRKFDSSLTELRHRFQFGFNLSDMANGMPGAMIVYKADKSGKLLFASHMAIDFFGCTDWDDFMKYTRTAVWKLIYTEDLQYIRSEIKRQTHLEKNKNNIHFVNHRIVTKDGRVREVEIIGRLRHNAFYGNLYYVTLYDREQKLENLSSDKHPCKNKHVGMKPDEKKDDK